MARTNKNSFRNAFEGNVDIRDNKNRGPELHNVVHVWIGGNMNSNHSPNDPIFFLHHCQIDRIWARWQRENRKAVQYPAFGPFPGARLEDEMIPWTAASTVGAVRPKDVLNANPFPSGVTSILGEGYDYDTLK